MNNHALITGATGGLGKAFCVECAKRGLNLILTDVSKEKLSLLADSLKSTYKIKADIFTCNLMEIEEREKLFKFIEDSKIDLFLTINVAGLDYEGGIDTLTSHKISKVLRINTESTFDITRFAATTKHSGQFYIINVASMAGFFPMPLKALYSSSKKAIIQFSVAIKEEIKDKGGHILALCPAGLRTTARIRKSIDAQGLMGELTTVDVGTVVHKTIEKAFQDKSKYIPGVINQFIVGFTRLVPESVSTRYIYRRWARAHHKKSRLELAEKETVF